MVLMDPLLMHVLNSCQNLRVLLFYPMMKMEHIFKISFFQSITICFATFSIQSYLIVILLLKWKICYLLPLRHTSILDFLACHDSEPI